jgi:hypothetical protein
LLKLGRGVQTHEPRYLNGLPGRAHDDMEGPDSLRNFCGWLNTNMPRRCGQLLCGLPRSVLEVLFASSETGLGQSVQLPS